MQESASQLSALTRKLFADTSDLELRLELAQGDCASIFEGGSQVSACRGWSALQAVIRRAVEGQRATLVYGDYDVDGTVATLLLHRYLRANNVPGNFFIPSRQQHGYGLDAGVVEQAVSQQYQTLLAVDCGVSNAAEVALARKAGLDVAIIDHHACPA